LVRSGRGSRTAALASLAVAAVAVAFGGGLARGEPGDDAFLARLARLAPGEPVDTPSLAKLFLRVAGRLAADQSGVGMLQQLVRAPTAVEERVARRVASQFEHYGRSVVEFRHETQALDVEPASPLALYRALTAGLRTCWSLDLYNQQIETWGTGASDLRSILASREACGRFRTAAFHPAVAALVEEALAQRGRQDDEIRRLRADLVELERLVDDLIEIEGPE
jgi:hypothetical protein